MSDSVKCSFCGASGENVNIFRSNEHDDIYICEDCVKQTFEALKEYEEQEKLEKTLNNPEVMTPSDIREFLDQYVIGQDRAKEILSVAVYNHMKLLEHWDNIQEGDVEVEKSNILMVGPTGSGKTHLIKNLARLFKVPYAICDATTLTESGYVGSDVETVLQKLLNAANGDVKLAERGIVFIDEIDKKANKGGVNNSITRDVSGEGVQQALLKLIEGNKVDVQLEGQRKHPYSDMVQIDTSKILFIVGGAFPGIDEIIKRRLNYKVTSSVGIMLEEAEEEKLAGEVDINEIIDKVNQDDFRNYGLIPEFLGRLPIICPLKELTEDQLCQILTEPKNALVKQYKELLKYDKVDLEFDQDALKAIANKAIVTKTGARGLRSIMENLLLDTMYSIPGQMRKEKNKRGSLVITKDCVENDKKPELVIKAA